MLLRLSVDDAARFGVRDLEFDPGRLTFGEQEDLQAVGVLLTDDLSEWSTALKGVPRIDASGQPILDAEGKPARDMPGPTWRAVIWLALRRANLLASTAESWPAMRDVSAAVDVITDAAPDPKGPDPSSTPPETSD